MKNEHLIASFKHKAIKPYKSNKVASIANCHPIKIKLGNSVNGMTSRSKATQEELSNCANSVTKIGRIGPFPISLLDYLHRWY